MKIKAADLRPSPNDWRIRQDLERRWIIEMGLFADQPELRRRAVEWGVSARRRADIMDEIDDVPADEWLDIRVEWLSRLSTTEAMTVLGYTMRWLYNDLQAPSRLVRLLDEVKYASRMPRRYDVVLGPTKEDDGIAL